MSKQFKNKDCVYCVKNKSSTTGDHVFCREFFAINQRDNLPKVPACIECNNKKSHYEHYFTTVSPFGEQHALNNLAQVEPRLRKNRALHLQLALGAEKKIKAKINMCSGEIKNLSSIMTIPIDIRKIAELYKYITKALVWYHFKMYLTIDSKVKIYVTEEIVEPKYNTLIFGLKGQHITNNLGVGRFVYKGIKEVGDSNLSVWNFTFPGHVILTNDQSNFASITAITANSKFFEKKCFAEWM